MTKKNSPIAIVGIGCRFPGGASSPGKYWELLKSKKDAIVDTPKDRWSNDKFYDPDTEATSKCHTKQAGFLEENIKDFDPMFFNISPREAKRLDPQQRVLLEVSWEALEDAGIDTQKFKGSNSSVFIGNFCLDAMTAVFQTENRHLIDNYTSISCTATMLSNRLSYFYDLKGPSLSIDTACSSSLVAIHYACQSIWNGDSNVSLAGGVNIMLKPETIIGMSKGRFLSKHARSKSFDSDAGGYVRGEGAGIVVLKDYATAVKDGDYIYALVEGSGVNQDGLTQGITVPNGDSQFELIQKVYNEANFDASNLDYIEAHGTGTPVGDPVEFNSLNKIISESPEKKRKYYIGSVKSNMGHLEAAAGVAGFIKATLTIDNKEIAPNLHFSSPNSSLNYENSKLTVPTETIPISKSKKKVYAAVNSFGYGGTNCHILLSSYKNRASKKKKGTYPHQNYVIPISGNQENALAERSKQLLDILSKDSPINIQDIAFSLSNRKSHLHHRAAIIAHDKEDLRQKIALLSEGSFDLNITSGKTTWNNENLVFVYTGMGPQWWGMGRELLKKLPFFKERVLYYDKAFKDISGWSIYKEIIALEEDSQMHKTQIAQPANFVIQAALTDLWKRWGVQPDVVVGHSVGEVTAAYVSGALSLKDALIVSYHRSRLQGTLAGQGAMLACGLSYEKAQKIVENRNIDIAAVNSQTTLTLAGDEEELKLIAEELTKEKVFNKMLTVEVPYHSYLMNPIKDELSESLKRIKAKTAKIKLYSTAYGKVIDGTEMGSAYWWDNVRNPVLFEATLAKMLKDERPNFIEVGPHPVLRHSIQESITLASSNAFSLFSIKKGQPEEDTFLRNISKLYCSGYNINWDSIYAEGDYIKTGMYPWQREEHWHESKTALLDRLSSENHPFLRDQFFTSTPTFEAELNSAVFPYLKDHKVMGNIVFPGAGYVESMVAIFKQKHGDQPCAIEDLKFLQILNNDGQYKTLSTSYHESSHEVQVHSRTDAEDSNFVAHAKGKVSSFVIPPATWATNLLSQLNESGKEIDTQEFYKNAKTKGLEYGDEFQVIKKLFKKDALGWAEIESSLEDPYYIPPTVLDGAFQLMIEVMDRTEGLYLPVGIERIDLFKKIPGKCSAIIELVHSDDTQIVGNILLVSPEQQILATIKGVICQKIELGNNKSSIHDLLARPEWVELEQEAIKEEEGKKFLFIHQESNKDPFATKYQIYLHTEANHIVITDSDIDNAEGTAWGVNNGDFTENFAAMINDAKITDVIYFADAIHELTPETDFAAIKSQELIRLQKVTQAIIGVEQTVNLNIVTTGVQRIVSEDIIDPRSAIYWGLNLVYKNEFPKQPLRLIDLPINYSDKDVNQLFRVLHSNSRDIAIRHGKPYAQYFKMFTQDDINPLVEAEKVSDKSFELSPVDQDGGNIKFTTKTRKAPGTKQIEVKVISYNLKESISSLKNLSNLKDQVVGVYGHVTSTGKEITGLDKGDVVLALVDQTSLNSYLLLDEQVVFKASQGDDSHNHAIAILDEVKAHLAVSQLEQVGRSQKVLITNANEGAGIAAIQLAQSNDCRVYTTVSDKKFAESIKALGVEQVYEDADHGYLDRMINDDTEKFDAIINNSPNKDITKHQLNTLNYGGKYIDLVVSETEELQLPLSLFNKGISYSTINIDHLLKHAPYKINEAIKKVVELRNDQTITNALFNTYNVAELADLNESGIQKGLGSTLVHLNSTELDIQQRYSVTDSISEEKTYVITGGTKGLGLSLAGWLGDKGAKHIALLSRSGAKGIDQPEIVEELKSSGVKVNVYSVDVSQYDSVKATLKKIGDEMPVIGGVIHGAMVLDDAMISDLTYAHYEKVLAPKVNGLLNLHFLLEDEDLDFFINFSSVSSLIGNPGQANYVAANAFTENFSNYRRANGKVSTTFNLGPVSGVGAVARNNEVEKLLSTLGIPTITPEEVFEALDKALATKYDQVGVLKLEWAKASQAFPVLTNDDTYIDLKEHFSSGTGTSNSDDLNNWRANYESLDYGEKVQLIIQTFRNEVAQLLTLPVETVESNMNLNALGLDSILAVELSMNMKEKFGIGIPTVDLIGGLAIEEIARKFAQNEESNEADEQEHNSSIENEASEELLVLIEE